jgi:hypothetical protein
VVLDETSVKTNMNRLRGRSTRGHRLVAAVPHGHWKTSTFAAGLRCDRVTASLVIDGATNGKMFLAYIEQILAPTLSSGDVVIMDNLPSHKIVGVREGNRGTRRDLALSPSLQSRSEPDRASFARRGAQTGRACGIASPPTPSREARSAVAGA